ncbi:MAG: hypothetical protein ACRC6K_05575 [Fusobacteriaceae bacterium]
MNIKLTILFFSIILFSATRSEENFFPIFGKEVTEKGYILPKAFGINFIYVNMKQGINVNKINLSGSAKINLSPLIPTATVNFNNININVKHAETTNNIKIIKGDLWIFPFLNVYTLFGESTGETKAKIDLSIKNIPNFSIKNQDFTLNYKGLTYGVGTTLAGGYKNIFALLDINFSRTNLDIIEGQVDAFILSPRIGYSFSINSIPTTIWFGAMYQEISQTLKGDISDVIPLPFPVKNGQFEISEKSKEPWNNILGIRIELSESIEIMGELGFGERESFSLACGYRF